MTVHNMHREALVEGDVRIDRKTIFGNPFVIGRDGSRAQVIEQYEKMIRRKLAVEPEFGIGDTEAAIKALRGKRLFCWCAPAPCHGEVLERICQELHKKENKA